VVALELEVDINKNGLTSAMLIRPLLRDKKI
jgi:hypothetical protein